MPPFSAEVIVVGAGPGGSTVARELARRGHEVLLLDKARFPRPKVCGDGLTPRAVAALRRLGLEEEVTGQGYRVEAARLYAGPGLDLRVPFRRVVDGWPPYGVVVPRLTLDATLLDAARRAGARFVSGVKVTRWRCERRGCTVTAQDGRVWQAPLVVVATGAAWGLYRRAGLAADAPHDILAARGYWQGVADLSDALEFFFLPEIPYGYAWLFPVGEGRANVGVGVYRPATGDAPRVRALLQALVTAHPALAPRLRGAQPLGPIQAYPLRSDFPRRPWGGEGWLAVGEAAGLVNPVSGEGIDLALESGALAAEALSRALRSGKPWRAWPLYRRAALRRFGNLCRGLRLLRSIVMRPRPLRILIRRAARHPGLLRRIVGITLGSQSPYRAFWPSTWWWLLS